MQNITPLKKMSKRQQKAFYSKQRGNWYGINPVTRTVPSGKRYDRNRIKREDERSLDTRAALETGCPGFFT